jgi:hypothetical protein
MRTLYRTWTTEMRPLTMPAGDGGREDPAEQWLQLARLRLTLDANQQVAGDVIVDDRERPILVSSRVLQEGR